MVGENTKIKTNNGDVLAKDIKAGDVLLSVDGEVTVESVETSFAKAFEAGLFQGGNVSKLIVSEGQEFAIDSNVSGVEGGNASAEDIKRSLSHNFQSFESIKGIFDRENATEDEHPVTKLSSCYQLNGVNQAPFIMWIKDLGHQEMVNIKTSGPFFANEIITR